MKWVKQSFASNIEEVLEEELNASLDVLKKSPSHTIPHMKELVKAFLSIQEKSQKVFIVGDYDADGITSTTALSLVFDELGIDYTAYIPRRFTDGYGLNPTIAKKAKSEKADVLLTIDNGTTAKEVLDGFEGEKIIIDHHLPTDGQVPSNALIINPHVDGMEFSDYCAAGLMYKISEVLKKEKRITEKTHHLITILGCIGTIADVMPLIDENRVIVKRGMKLLKKTEYVDMLAEVLSVLPETFTAKDIAFGVAPLINASGRLYDKGGQMVYATLYQTFSGYTASFEALIKNNEERKKIQESFFQTADTMYDKESTPIILTIPDCPEGIIGIIAGRMAEKYHRPSFIFTKAKEEGVLKGSARSGGEFHVKEFLDAHGDLFLRFGGHKGAAGMSIKESKMEEFQALAKKDENEPILYYDLELLNPTKEAVETIIHELNQYEPFGEGFRAPTFRFSCDIFSARNIGTNGIKMVSTDGLEILSFRERNAFASAKKIEVIGNFSINDYLGQKSVQAEIIDYHILETEDADDEYVPAFLRH